MTEAQRSMWSDLYHFFEKCADTKPDSTDWPRMGEEANRILEFYKQDFFVQEVLAVTMAYWMGVRHGE